MKAPDNLAPGFIEHTFRVEFLHRANNLSVTVDVVSADDVAAVNFARERFRLDASWELLGCEQKYDRKES